MYRKSRKPPAKMPDGWPYNPVPQAKNKYPLPTPEQQALDAEIEALAEKRRPRMDHETVRTLVGAGLITLLVVVVLAVMIAFDAHDEGQRRQCIAAGGTVVELHNARSSTFSTPWACVGEGRELR